MIVHDGSMLIKDEIKLRARSKIREIDAQTLAKIDEMDKKTQLSVEMIKEDILLDGKRRAKTETKKIRAQTNVMINGIMRDAKEDIINDAIDEAMKELNNAKPSEFKNELMCLLKYGISESMGDMLTVIANKDTLDFFDAKMINDIVNECGRKVRIEKKIKKMNGGIILYQESNNMFLDYSFDSMFKSKEDNIRTEVSLILFGHAEKIRQVLE